MALLEMADQRICESISKKVDKNKYDIRNGTRYAKTYRTSPRGGKSEQNQ
jgi:hypothetical protein